MNYIGIDLGTSAVKLLLMQGDGKILKIVNREYPISFPKPGWSQQNPEDWYRETMAGIQELLQDSDEKIHGLKRVMEHYSDKTEWTFPEKMVNGTAVIKLTVTELSCKEHK